ncbi:MAG TPA: Rieske 2Fe-2S domain-containing protein [Aggregatilineales bacterium]|nr:Rieske 2Fe-2S domain-containing protein [Anaerolineales bacterium]HRE49345.1 Rieske 2Fe-2S domain-containing protein [Aggregatilineales bacterium]
MPGKVWIRLCALEQLPSDKAVNIFVNGQRYVVIRQGESAYMVQGYCTHMLYPLKDSKVENCVLTCNLHGSKFDIRDGSVQHWPMPMVDDVKQKKMLRTFETRVEGGEVYVAWETDDPSKVRARF